MNIPNWIIKLFKVIDSCDAEGFVKFLTDDATLVFANSKPVKGKREIQNLIAGFFSSIKGLKHKILEAWKVDEVVILRGEVTYSRKDDSVLTVPFANIFKMNGDLVKEYMIYADISQLNT